MFNFHDLNLVQVQKWSFALEKNPDFELDLYISQFSRPYADLDEQIRPTYHWNIRAMILLCGDPLNDLHPGNLRSDLQ